MDPVRDATGLMLARRRYGPPNCETAPRATFPRRALSNGRLRRNCCEPEAVMRHFRFAAPMLGVLLLGLFLLLVPHGPFAAEAAAAGGGAGNLALLDSKGQTTGECPLKHTDVQAD